MCDAQGISRNQILCHVDVEGLQVEKGFVGASPGESAVVIDFARLGAETGECSLAIYGREAGLAIHAQVMFAGVDGEREIGVVLKGAHPRAIESNLQSNAGTEAIDDAGILNEVDARLAGLGVGESVLRGVALHVEGRVLRAAGRRYRGGRRILGEG